MANLVHNEQVKLLANAYDRASTGCLVLGVFGPLWAAYSNQTTMGATEIAFGTTTWFLAALALHLFGLRILKRMIE